VRPGRRAGQGRGPLPSTTPAPLAIAPGSRPRHASTPRPGERSPQEGLFSTEPGSLDQSGRRQAREEISKIFLALARWCARSSASTTARSLRAVRSWENRPKRAHPGHAPYPDARTIRRGPTDFLKLIEEEVKKPSRPECDCLADASAGVITSPRLLSRCAPRWQEGLRSRLMSISCNSIREEYRTFLGQFARKKGRTARGCRLSSISDRTDDCLIKGSVVTALVSFCARTKPGSLSRFSGLGSMLLEHPMNMLLRRSLLRKSTNQRMAIAVLRFLAALFGALAALFGALKAILSMRG
jgi:hypothetical protein